MRVGRSVCHLDVSHAQSHPHDPEHEVRHCQEEEEGQAAVHLSGDVACQRDATCRHRVSSSGAPFNSLHQQNPIVHLHLLSLSPLTINH